MSHIEFENFYDEAKLFMIATAGRSSQRGVTIENENDPRFPKWEWYCFTKGWPQRAKFWRGVLRGGGKLTLPCDDPARFDYVACQGYVPMPPSTPPPPESAEHRKRVVETYVRRSAADARPKGERRPDWKPPVMSPDDVLRAIAERNRREPMVNPLSMETLVQMGAGRKQSEAA